MEFEHLLKKDSVILEAGCGEGQNVRYLAKIGYCDIDAFDLSEAGISKLKWLCEKEGLSINAFVDDLSNPNGIHIIHTFTNTVPASPDIAPFAVGLADEGEILDLYSDWEVMQFKTYVFDDEHPNVPKHQHAVNKLVARKKTSC